MTQERLTEVAMALAKRYLLDRKLPPLDSTSEMRKWAKEEAERIAVSPEDFVEATKILLQKATDDLISALGRLQPTKPRKGLGFGK